MNLLVEMKPNERAAITTLLEGACANVRGVRAILSEDEGQYSTGEHYDLRQELGLALGNIEAVLERVRVADAKVVLAEPSLPRIPNLGGVL